MPKVKVRTIASFCDTLLHTREIQDYDGAVNGLQVANRNGTVSRIAATVDASLATARLAVNAGADLMLVHHGLFWSRSHPWVGKKFELQRLLIENNLAVYSSHLPLDAHPEFGNNIKLSNALGLGGLKPFFHDHGQFIGFRARKKMHRNELAKRLEQATGNQPKILPGGPDECQKIGIVTGGAGSDLKKAFDEGVDTFVTGEGPHWTFGLAEELGINVLYGGHYATETFGVKALAAHISKTFELPWVFIDYPTGL